MSVHAGETYVQKEIRECNAIISLRKAKMMQVNPSIVDTAVVSSPSAQHVCDVGAHTQVGGRCWLMAAVFTVMAVLHNDRVKRKRVSRVMPRVADESTAPVCVRESTGRIHVAVQTTAMV